MKKIGIILVLFVMLTVLFSNIVLASFRIPPDVVGTDYEESVVSLMELGIVDVYQDGRYIPKTVVSRAELAKAIIYIYKLDAAADAARGSTSFSDVPSDHWASGFINVASQYGFLPDASGDMYFPDQTATIEDAVIALVRTLGFKSVVEAGEGNLSDKYFTKANEIGLLKDVSYSKRTDNLTRGNDAIMLWNAMRIKVWNTSKTLIEDKFTDFAYYEEVPLGQISITNSGAVLMTCAGTVVQEYEVKLLNLLHMISGMKMNILANVKDEEVVYAKENERVIEGIYNQNGKINGTSYTFATPPQEGDYVLLIVDGKTVVSYVIIPSNSYEVDQDTIEDLIEDDEDLEVVYLYNGEFITAADLESGYVLTKISNIGAVSGTYYLVANSKIEGEFSGCILYDNVIETIIVGNKKIPATEYTSYYEYDSTLKKYTVIMLQDLWSEDSKYMDADVTVALDYAGNAVGVYFDEIPEVSPTPIPTNVPTTVPTNAPTTVPTNVPTTVPTTAPTTTSTSSTSGGSGGGNATTPTSVPTKTATKTPTKNPTPTPSETVEKYEITALVEGKGRISPSGKTEVTKGNDKTYRITPNTGYQIADVLVDDKSVGKVSTYTFKNVKAKHTIVAKFEEKKEVDIHEVFNDVNEQDWFASAVKYVNENSLMNGMGEKEFAPRNNMTRGMLVTVLYRSSKSTDKEKSTFKDVDENQYYANPVAWAAKNGIVNGMGDNNFGPNNNITREQIVTILYRYAKFMDSSIEDMEGVMGLAGYEDYAQVSDYATNAFRWAIHNGIITGKGEGVLAPKDLATRAEVATMLMRFLEK